MPEIENDELVARILSDPDVAVAAITGIAQLMQTRIDDPENTSVSRRIKLMALNLPANAVITQLVGHARSLETYAWMVAFLLESGTLGEHNIPKLEQARDALENALNDTNTTIIRLRKES